MDSVVSTLTSTSAPLWHGLVLGAMIGGLISLIINILTPSIFDLIDKFKNQLGRARKKNSYEGVYDCEYHIPWKSGADSVIFERIYLKKMSRSRDVYAAYLMNNPDAANFREVEKPELRAHCELMGGNYLIGWWAHPDPDDRLYGSFALHLDEAGQSHTGLWTGQSKTYKRMLSGRWIWHRNKKIKMSGFNFYYRRFFGYKS
jgi:hypothetical protein